MTFGTKLRMMMALRDMIQNDLAKAAGLSPSTISGYVRDETEPTARAALRMAQALRCSLEWLLDDRRGYEQPEL